MYVIVHFLPLLQTRMSPVDSLELPEGVPTGLVLRLATTAAFHPFEYSKVLIQLGHEPVQPRATKTLLGRPALAYPSVFSVCGS